MNENYPNPVHSEFSFQGAKQRPASQFLPDWSICHGAHYQLPLTKLKYVLLIQLSWYDTFNMGQGWYCTFNMIQLIRTPPTIWDTADMEPQYDSTQLIRNHNMIQISWYKRHLWYWTQLIWDPQYGTEMRNCLQVHFLPLIALWRIFGTKMRPNGGSSRYLSLFWYICYTGF